jgi:hypothetical protein
VEYNVRKTQRVAVRKRVRRKEIQQLEEKDPWDIIPISDVPEEANIRFDLGIQEKAIPGWSSTQAQVETMCTWRSAD